MKVKPILLFSSVFLLASCGSKASSYPGSKIQPGSSVLDVATIDENVAELKIKDETLSPLNFTNLDLGSYTIQSQSYIDKGLIVARNGARYVGFYSTFGDGWILPPSIYDPNSYIGNNGSYLQVYTNNYTGFVLKYREPNGSKFGVLDGFGNDLTLDGLTATSNIEDVYYSVINEELYLRINYYQSSYSNYKQAFFHYLSETNVVSVSELPQATTVDDEKEPITFNFGDLFYDVDEIDLSPYGLKGTLSKKDNLYTVFSEHGVESFTFALPENVMGSVIIGSSCFYQLQYQVPDDATDYTYSDGNAKYVLKIVRIDLSNGNASEMNKGIVFTGFSTVKDKEGYERYGLVQFKEIGDGRVLGAQRTMIMDQNGDFHDDLTATSPTNFKKLPNGNYYNEVTHILYGDNKKPIAYLDSINPTISTSGKVFIGRVNGKYGCVGFDGKVVVPFDYDSVDSTFRNGYTIVTKGQSKYAYNTKTGATTSISNDAVFIGSGLYYIMNESGTDLPIEVSVYSIDSPSLSLKDFYIKYDTTPIMSLYKSLFFGNTNLVIRYTNTNSEEACTVGADRTWKLKPSGTEKKSYYEDSYVMTLGTKYSPGAFSTQKVYYFTPSTSDTYYVHIKGTNYRLTLESADLYQMAYTYNYDTSSEQQNNISNSLTKNETYYIKIEPYSSSYDVNMQVVINRSSSYTF